MKIETLFSLESNDDIDDIELWNEIIGFKAIEYCRLGNKIPFNNSKSISLASYWTAGYRKREADSINSEVGCFLKAFSPFIKNAVKLVDEYQLDSGLAVFIWLPDDFDFSDIDIYLDKKNMALLAELKADFAVRLYQY